MSYVGSQTAGNLNVVVVAWNDTASAVSSVSDSSGNRYLLAIGPTVETAGSLSQSIYYAENIAAAGNGGNTVTVKFSAAVPFPDIRILEYSGVVKSDALDAVAGAAGSNATADSGALVTTGPKELLVAADYTSQGTTAPGPGFQQRILTSPDADMVEDEVAATAGTYHGTASLTGYWVMQMVAFRSVAVQPPTAPASLTATAAGSASINLTWSASTSNVGLAGYRVERCQGSGCSNFAQVATATNPNYADTSCAPATSYSYRVRAADTSGNLSGYSNTASASTPPDTQPPTPPSGLTATATSSTQVGLSWTASTDNVGVTEYFVERCQDVACNSFVQIGTSAGTTYADSALIAATAYSYRARATDAAGNLSGYSNVATATTQPTPSVPSYAQSAFATPQSPSTTVNVSLLTSQSAGDLNVVAVGWDNTTSTVSSVTDSSGNPYTLAVGPTVLTGMLSQSIYYSANIRANAGTNVVSVNFSTPAPYPDVRVVEYRGIAPSNPLDVVAAAAGTGNTSAVGPVTTTNAADLLVAADYTQDSNTGPGSGYALRVLTQPDDDLVEDQLVSSIGSYSATAPLTGGNGWVMQLVAFRAAVADTVAPVVTLTTPAGGAVLSGTVSVGVTATNAPSGVQSIQLLVDGIAVGTLSTVVPATFSLDTTAFANGTHALSASAVNGTHLVGFAAPVSVSFNNLSPGNPAVTGMWSGLVKLPLVSAHAHQLPNSNILMSDGQSLGYTAWTWDTTTNALTNVTAPANIFCSGHTQMADGRIFFAGGHNVSAHMGLTVANVFDPVTMSWTVLPDMSYPRWYPSVITLPDGRELVLSGETTCDNCDETIAEVYDPKSNAWTPLTAAPFFFNYYPHAYVLTDGGVLVTSTDEVPTVSQALDLTHQTWTAFGGPAVEGGSAAMYRPNQFLKAGTSTDPSDATRPSSALAFVLDMTQPAPTWQVAAPMNDARTYHNLTLLPDGNVLCTGGGPTTAGTDTANAWLQPELWASASQTWTLLNAMNAPRIYHSEALLMPDARVLVLGSGRFMDGTFPTDQFSAEFFSPPYLFKGPRPLIASAPASVLFGQPFTVQTPDAARIASVVLMRFGSATHGVNLAQRYVPLSFTKGSGSLNVSGPSDANLATPGNYMLFLVDTNGVPSVAAEVRL